MNYSGNVIIEAGLIEPPSEEIAIYTVTFFLKRVCKLNILINSESEMKDFYFKYLRKKGLFDSIDYILSPPEKECGLNIKEKQGNINIRGFFIENQTSIINSVNKLIRY